MVPAAGFAHLLGRLPCSKEVFPLAVDGRKRTSDEMMPLACDYALDAMRFAGIEKVFVMLREGKWDVPAALGGGSTRGIHLAYHIVKATKSVPHTLDRAYPFVEGKRVVLAFPDLLFEPQDAIADTLRHHDRTGADIVLGTFPAPEDQSADCVDVRGGTVTSIEVKPQYTSLQQAWIIALWTPAFTEFLHHYISAIDDEHSKPHESDPEERHLGEVFQAAITKGFRIEAVSFPKGRFLDIGISEKLRQAVQGQW